MPQARHYDNVLLDNCYLYTFDEKYKQTVMQELGRNACDTKVIFLKNEYKNFSLKKVMFDSTFDGFDERQTFNILHQYYIDKYKLTTHKKNNKTILEANGYNFKNTIENFIVKDKIVRINSVEFDNAERIKIESEVNTSKNGFELRHSIGVISTKIGMRYDRTRLMLERMFLRSKLFTRKFVDLTIPEFYAFVINNEDVIKTAFIVFPLIALLISCPFILIEYHKFGSISVIKTLIIYSLVLYLICAYFLIILPLPSINEVSLLTTPQVQLMPGKFIIDFINNTSLNLTHFSTYIKSITESYFYVPIYNLLLTLPFGMYLRYYFKCNLKKTILFTFILSLFFELTQLSGLYYIYPRGYRLFDIDDLLLNTIGGIIGYLICGIFIKKLPAREEIDKKALEAGKKVSGLRRTTAFFLDLFLYSLLLFIIKSLLSEIKMEYASVATIFIYYVLIAFFLKGSTLGEKFINLKVADYNEKNNFFRLFLRIFSFIFFYAGLPFGTFYLVFNSGLVLSKVLEGILAVIFVGYIIIFYMITGVRFLFTNKDMLYERVSKTKMMSTIK